MSSTRSRLVRLLMLKPWLKLGSSVSIKAPSWLTTVVLIPSKLHLSFFPKMAAILLLFSTEIQEASGTAIQLTSNGVITISSMRLTLPSRTTPTLSNTAWMTRLCWKIPSNIWNTCSSLSMLSISRFPITILTRQVWLVTRLASHWPRPRMKPSTVTLPLLTI